MKTRSAWRAAARGLLALAFAWAGLAPVFAAAALPPVELSDPQQVVALDGRSQWWVDAAQLGVDQLEAAGDALPWALREPGTQYRIDGKALWLRFDAVARHDGRWYLEVGASGVDRVQLFFRDDAGRWVEREAGDTRAVPDWPLPGRLPTFELSRTVGKPVRYWLRVEHTRVDFAAPMAIYGQGSLLASREREQFLLGAYFGLAALIVLVALAHGIAFRDRNFAVYAVYVGAFAAGQAAYLGVGAQHLWSHQLRWNEISTFVLPGVSTATGLWFARTVTEPGRFSRLLDAAVWGLIAAVLAAVALDAVLESRASFSLVMLLTAVALVAIIALALLAWWRADDPHVGLIVLGFLPVIVLACFPVARGLNLIPASVFTRYGLSIGAALEMPLLYYALSLRGSRRREAQVRAAALSRNDTLTGLAHTRTLLQRMEDALVRARSQKHACALLVFRIANFQAIAHEFGRDGGDRALVVAASLLRRAAADIDTPARVGEHDFALLMEGPSTTALATARAQQVVAGGLRQNEALPPTCTLTFHVTVALLPEAQLDAPASLQWLVDAVDTMGPGERKLIRPLNF